MQLPSLHEMNALHRKYAPSRAAWESVWVHCHVVRRLSLQLADNYYPVNRQLLEAGALLHDIGVYRLYHNGVLDEANYITHGLLGYELLKEEGFDEALCRFALLHTGVGITKQDVEQQNLPLPPRDYVAETDEERIVMYADKFHTKSKPPTFLTAQQYADMIGSRFGEAKAQTFRALVDEFGEPDLVPLIKRYGHTLRK
ncbi:MAG TPA: HD domain-containing protein [Candidatus Saccharimonadales bacterium]